MQRHIPVISVLLQKVGAVFFNAGCNEQVFSLNPEKILRRSVLPFSEKNAKTDQLRRIPLTKK